MTEMNKINIDALENAAGGRIREIDNPDASYANIRNQAGLQGTILFRMKNGQKVDTTGNTIKRDGFIWYEIYLDGGKYGWVAGNLIGY